MRFTNALQIHRSTLLQPGAAGVAPTTSAFASPTLKARQAPARQLRLPHALACVPRRLAVSVRAGGRQDDGQPSGAAPDAENETLAHALARRQLALPPDHPGLDLRGTVEVRQALHTLFAHAPARWLPPAVIREACVMGCAPQFDAVLRLIRHGVLDPNCHSADIRKGTTLLHAIAIDGSDASDYAPGYATLDERIGKLVEAGTDINRRDRLTQLTALDYAMLRNEMPVVKALLKHGALNSPHL